MYEIFHQFPILNKQKKTTDEEDTDWNILFII